MDILYSLKTRTPGLRGKCSDVHLSIVGPVRPSIVMAGGGMGVGDCGGYMLVTMETHVPLDQEHFPPPESSVVCTLKIAGDTYI